MHSETFPIAVLDLVEVKPDDRRTAVHIELATPQKLSEQGAAWSCAVVLDGLDTRQRMIYGEDSMQALCLAIRHIASRLRGSIEMGAVLVDPNDGTVFPIDAYFDSPPP